LVLLDFANFGHHAEVALVERDLRADAAVIGIVVHFWMKFLFLKYLNFYINQMSKLF